HFPRLGEMLGQPGRQLVEARANEKAIGYWQRAAQHAIARSANVEAIHHLTTALGLIQLLPETPQRAQQELALQLALGVPLVATKGYAAPEAGRAYERASALCQEFGETPLLFPALRGLWAFHHIRGELPIARELGARCLAVADR